MTYGLVCLETAELMNILCVIIKVACPEELSKDNIAF